MDISLSEVSAISRRAKLNGLGGFGVVSVVIFTVNDTSQGCDG